MRGTTGRTSIYKKRTIAKNISSEARNKKIQRTETRSDPLELTVKSTTIKKVN